MPLVVIKTTIDGKEESLSEFWCDWPNCPKPAEHVVGAVRELRAVVMMCTEHVEALKRQQNDAA
jgi:hypothetical protein